MLETTKIIVEDHIGSQKEIANLFLNSAWVTRSKRYMDHATEPSWVSSKWMAETYTKMVANHLDNIFAGIRLSNSLLYINMEIYKTYLQQIKGIETVFLRMVVDNTKLFEKATKEFNAQRGSNEEEIHRTE